ncbi:MAG: Type 1 glutamine amidotransferase-like domain-containing protein [Clostridia bacterium]|nr:Type 1 glutamine amidotransferase-like domain-containing protein [Clostridia bacterium]
MKTIFLTSDFGAVEFKNNKMIPCAINNTNGLTDQLKECITKKENFVFIASNPDSYERTDGFATNIFESFKLSRIEFKNLIIVDNRNKDNIQQIINSASFVFICGGHVPTQNEFITKIGLKEILTNYNGVIMGQSAGSMNLAKTVYNYPEDLSEINDPKFLQGLGFTDISIIPHFNLKTGNEYVKENIDLMNDYLLKDSHTLPLYCIANNSHIKIDENGTNYYGDVYYIKNGNIKQISQSKHNKKYNKNK